MKSLDISNKIPEGIVRLLEDVKIGADRLSTPFVVVGAMARDFILSYGFELNTGRRMQDIDLCIEVSKWEEFHAIRRELTTPGIFNPASGMPHRLIHSSGIPLDIVPFGAIETSGRQIAWPPAGEIQMNAVGLREAARNTVDVQIAASPTVVVRVMSLPSQAALKLISWKDRHLGTRGCRGSS